MPDQDDDILEVDPKDIVEEPQEDAIIKVEELRPLPDEELQKKKEEGEYEGLDEDDVANLIIDDRDDLPDAHPVLNNSLVNDPGQLVSTNIQQGQPLQKALENPARTDRLLIAVKDRQPTTTLLNKVLEEIAEEAAYLKAYRNKHWDGEADVSDTSAKRVRMLRSIVETIMEKEKQKNSKSGGKIDFYGENFQRVLKYFLQAIEKTFKKVNIPQQFADNFFGELAKEFDGFERKAEKIYYGKNK